MALIPSAGVNAPGYSLPMPLRASLRQLVVEKLPSDAAFDLAVRDGKTGFTFFKSKDISTITKLKRSCSASPAETCWFQKSLPTRSAAPSERAPLRARSPSARRCNRSRSPA